MSQSRARKRNLLRRVRRQRLKYITILPSLITLLNGICGFAAIGFASKGIGSSAFYRIDLSNFAWAGYLIFIAMVADMLDGRVARMSQTTSSFGGQLDSLCDMVSFGVAPAFLMMKVLEYKVLEYKSSLANPELFITDFMGRLIWLAAAVYMACAAIRLARFNVENEDDETYHMSFIGLPTPAAAGIIASLIVFYKDMLPEFDSVYHVGEKMILYSLPFVAIGTAILMISRIRYPHLINYYLKGKKPMTHLLWSVGVVGFIFLCNVLQGALVLSFCGFGFSGFLRWFYRRVLRSRTSRQNAGEPPILSIAKTADSIDDSV